MYGFLFLLLLFYQNKRSAFRQRRGPFKGRPLLPHERETLDSQQQHQQQQQQFDTQQQQQQNTQQFLGNEVQLMATEQDGRVLNAAHTLQV